MILKFHCFKFLGCIPVCFSTFLNTCSRFLQIHKGTLHGTNKGTGLEGPQKKVV